MESQQSRVVCSRFSVADLERVERAAEIMGDATVSKFVRTATVMIAEAVIEAATDLGETSPGSGSWDRAWMEGTIERKEDA